MKYTVIQVNSKKKIITEVQKLLDEGWKLQGGISCGSAGIGMSILFTQALVKE